MDTTATSTSGWSQAASRFTSQGSPTKGVVSVVVDPRKESSNVLTIKEEHVVGRGTSVTCGGITVTSINVTHDSDPSHSQNVKNIKYYEKMNGDVAVKCEVPGSNAVDDDSGSDSEVSKIDFSGVHLRLKKKRSRRNGEESQDGFGDEEPERPMSWEGELSDAEMSIVTGGKQEGEESMEGVQLSPQHTSKPINFADNINEAVLEQTRLKGEQQMNNGDATGQSGNPRELPLLVDKLLGGYNTPSNSPILQQRHQHHQLTKQHSHLSTLPPNPSPDSAIHSAYSYSSPAASPAASRHLPSSGFSSPFTPSLSRNNSDASQYGGSQHSSCYSYNSETFSSPTHSPVQSRHLHGYSRVEGSPLHVMAGGVVYGSRGMIPHNAVDDSGHLDSERDDERDPCLEDKMSCLAADLAQHSALTAPPGISRQQLINSPCPICGDKISGFHYGIFSCESCKGFFKRTVQNRKNYVCLRGSQCPVTIATRKKCPACRFEKCLKMGMKLEAIREDRTRGGRSTYQCSYSVPASLLQSNDSVQKLSGNMPPGETLVKLEAPDIGSPNSNLDSRLLPIPQLLQEIMDVERLWHCNDREMLDSPSSNHHHSPSSAPSSPSQQNNADSNPELCNIADHRLYKIVKWCKSLPLFKNISIDDQICLLLNSWWELLLFSCCFRSMSSPGEIRVSLKESISLARAKDLGLKECIERMLNFTQHLRRLRLDKYEYVAMKVIILLTSDVNGLREPEKVRASQEKALQALQHYTLAHYPDIPSKFGELLLRIPELQRTCQVGKEMSSPKQKEDDEGPSFNFLMELLRGDH